MLYFQSLAAQICVLQTCPLEDGFNFKLGSAGQFRLVALGGAWREAEGSRADEIMVELQSQADKKMTKKEKKRMAAAARREEGTTECKGCMFDGRKMS